MISKQLNVSQLIFFVIFLGLNLIFTQMVAAQDSRGTIRGTVTDSKGTKISNASIKITDIAKNSSVNLTSNNSGFYQASYLTPGSYKIEADAANFQKTTLEGITLQINQTLKVDIQMEPGNDLSADTASIDSIIKAVYEVISGDAGKPRDWDRFRTLFHKDARLIPSGKNPQTGIVGATALSPEDYVKRAEPAFLKDGFFEKEVANRKEIYGNIAHVFSTYESFRKSDEKKPFMRGINSFQLLNDGKRWWIVTIFWQAETPENPIPKKYLKSKD